MLKKSVMAIVACTTFGVSLCIGSLVNSYKDSYYNKADIPKLTATSKPTQNMITLNWEMKELNNKTFKVFQKNRIPMNFKVLV